MMQQRRTIRKRIANGMKCIILLFALCGNAKGQVWKDSIPAAFDRFRLQHYEEKLFLHTSQNEYVTGETFWCKAYLTDAHVHQLSYLSKVAYLEMTDSYGKPVWQSSIRIDSALGTAFWQIPNTLKTGNYLLRAYTRWMRNNDPDYFFSKEIFILNPQKKPQISGAHSENIYLQSYPEGGQFVDGLENRISYHLYNAAGIGLNQPIYLIRDNKDTMLQTNPERFGMGEFLLTPEAGHKYTLALNDEAKGAREFKLLQTNANGYTIRMGPSIGGVIELRVNQSSGLSDPGCYLFMHCRQTNSRAFYEPFRNGEVIFRISEKELGEGINQFTIFNYSKIPVCERLYFRHPDRSLLFAFNTNKTYSNRAPVDLQIKSYIEGGQETSTNFSASVLKISDAAMVPENDILSYLYLESDLKGLIENPSYYFTNDTLQHGKQADLLMRTQGWRRFKWEDVMNNSKSKVTFIPEYSGPLVEAEVLGKSGKSPMPGQSVAITVPGTRFLFGVNKSDNEGKVIIPLDRREGRGELVLQVLEPGSDTMQVIPISSFDSSITQASNLPVQIENKTKIFLEEEMQDIQLSQAFGISQAGDIRAFDQADSLDFYGVPDHEYNLDDYIRFNSMEEVFREYVKEVDVRKQRNNYHLLVTNEPYNALFREDPLVLLNGIPIKDMDRIMKFDPLKIKSIGIVSRKYNLGGQAISGIISLHTYEGRLEGFELPAETLVADYEGLQVMREFPLVEYPTQKMGKSPDLRHLLHWVPDGKTSINKGMPIRFFTSDVPGIYAIIVQGLDAEGRAGSTVRFFEVR